MLIAFPSCEKADADCVIDVPSCAIVVWIFRTLLPALVNCATNAVIAVVLAVNHYRMKFSAALKTFNDAVAEEIPELN